MGKDYYKILNLPRTCKDIDIKRAYRSLASQWHPDKSSHPDAESRFQDILEAHDILIDPEKRQIYDKHGEEGLKPKSPHTHTSHATNPFHSSVQIPQTQVYRSTNGFPPEAQKLFQQFFGAGGPFSNMKQGSHGNSVYTATTSVSTSDSTTHVDTTYMRQSMIKTLYCTLEEIYTGVTKLVKITRSVNGQPEDKLIKVDIPKGCPEGREIVHIGAGDKLSDILPVQDVVFVVACKPHEIYERKGNDLHMNCTVNIREYINGFSITAPSLDRSPDRKVGHKYGGTLLIDKLPEYKIPNMGLPVYPASEPVMYGSLVLHVSIQLPQSL
jgi:DnaJ-class molecular chaperone